jgi:hypothetical protein
LSIAATNAAMTTGKISELPDFLVRSAGFNSCVPHRVLMDQLLCLPDPLTPAKGFSWQEGH